MAGEVRAFVEHTLGEEGMKKSVVVVATGDEPALLRIRAAAMATSIAEYFRDKGKDVFTDYGFSDTLLSGAASGGFWLRVSPPTTKGFPPSVFFNIATITREIWPD